MTTFSWPRWCNQFDALHDEVIGLYHSRRVWQTIRAMIDRNPAIQRSGIAEHWMTLSYSVSQLSAVRRQTDGRNDVLSLRRSLDQLAETPSMATRAWFVSKLSPVAAKYPSSAAGFDIFAAAGSPYVDKRLIEEDRDRLLTDAYAAKRIVNKFIAHQADFTQKTGTSPTMTWGELDTAIDTIGELYRKYYRLRHPGVVLRNLVPDLPAGWDRMFETAWKPEGFELPV